MKQRTTFLVSDPEATNPDNFVISSDTFHVKSVPAIREDHITLSFQELPVDIQSGLKECKELVIHWAGGRDYETSNPYAARVPPGLHVFVTLLADTPPEICPAINKAFGISECKSVATSFSEIPGAHQFYSPTTSVSPFHSYLKELVCRSSEKCESRLQHLQSADYVDINYDAISQSLVVAAFTSKQTEPWQLTLQSLEVDKVEVGVLGLENPVAPESFTLSGFLHVVGVDKKLESVLFTFPSRHHRYPATYGMSLSEPAGLHPKLIVAIEEPIRPPQEECTLNAYYTLPRTLFVDKYQLSSANPQLLESLNIQRLRDIQGEVDLEAPAWANDLWGSSILIEVDTRRHEAGEGLKMELPVHTRYQEPRNATSAKTEFALPSVFWACKSEDWAGRSKNPFNRVRLGWEHLFPEQTMFYHLSPAEDGWKSLDVPVMNVEYAEVVKLGTVGVILAGFLWVLFKTILAGVRAQRAPVDPKKTQ